LIKKPNGETAWKALCNKGTEKEIGEKEDLEFGYSRSGAGIIQTPGRGKKGKELRVMQEEKCKNLPLGPERGG